MSSTGSRLSQIARKNIIDNFELAIVIATVVFYYVLRIFVGPIAAAPIAVIFGVIILILYAKNQKVKSAVKNWGS